MFTRDLAAILLIVLGTTSTARAQEPSCNAGHLLTVAADGTATRGTKDALKRAVQAGLPLRVGWGLDANADGVADVSHWSDAGFLTEFEGEIFAQIPDIQRQSPVRGQARVLMPGGRQRWSGLISTNGRLESHFDDGSEPQSVRLGSTWCVDARSAACVPQWRLAYRHDADGRAVEGSRAALVDAVRRGGPLRLAWGLATGGTPNRTLEHTADPVFLSAIDGDHVFVQLPEHVVQASYIEADKSRFDQPGVMWRGLMGSDGTFDAVMVDRASGKEVRRLPQRAAISWFALLPAAECLPSPAPTLAVPGGVRRQP
jgi:hypothetical protein